MLVLDSNIFIWAFVPEDSFHQECKKILDWLDQRVFLPQSIVAEIITTLTYKQLIGTAFHYGADLMTFDKQLHNLYRTLRLQ